MEQTEVNEEKQLIELKEKEQKNKNKLSKEAIDETFYSIVFAVIAMIYYILLIFASRGMKMAKLEKDIQVFAGIYTLVGILFVEKAYKSETMKRAITSIECFAIAFHSLSIFYFVKKYGFDFELYVGASSYVFAIYFTLKAIIIYTRGRRQVLYDLSDVKEIVKKDEPIKKEATKKQKLEEESEKTEDKKVTTSKKKTSKKKASSKKRVTKKKSKKEGE